MKPYNQEFLSEIYLKTNGEYNYTAMLFDANGDPTRIDYFRLDGTLLARTNMSLPDANGFYTKFVEDIYAENGTTKIKTRTITMTYNARGIGTKRETVVS